MSARGRRRRRRRSGRPFRRPDRGGAGRGRPPAPRRRSAGPCPRRPGSSPRPAVLRCGRTCAPPARFCPDEGPVMTPMTVPAHGEVVSFTTLYSPPTGFASPLHLALVELPGGAKFFCHGAGTKGLRLGARGIDRGGGRHLLLLDPEPGRAGRPVLAAPRRDGDRPRSRHSRRAPPSGFSGGPHEAAGRHARDRPDPGARRALLPRCSSPTWAPR